MCAAWRSARIGGLPKKVCSRSNAVTQPLIRCADSLCARLAVRRPPAWNQAKLLLPARNILQIVP